MISVRLRLVLARCVELKRSLVSVYFPLLDNPRIWHLKTAYCYSGKFPLFLSASNLTSDARPLDFTYVLATSV